MQPDATSIPITCAGCGRQIPAKSGWTRDGTAFRCASCSPSGPPKLIRLIRRRYPNTAIGTLYLAIAVTALWFRPVRKAGELMLVLAAIAVATVAIEHAGRPRR